MAVHRSDAEIMAVVREKYGEAATAALQGGNASCCGGGSVSPIVIGNYDPEATRNIPESAVLASLGCGNPTALAELNPGEAVLDLGSGGGLDVLLSARRVGPDGFAYGLDMTDEMLELAAQNKAAAGVDNVAFLKGQIEDVPLPDNSVDVIISNCVINLSVDKATVLREAYRVLKPGGRFAVSDIVFRGSVSDEMRADLDSWAGCVAGALEDAEYLQLLEESGFQGGAIEVTREFDASTLAGDCCSAPSGMPGEGPQAVSAFIRARKPE